MATTFLTLYFFAPRGTANVGECSRALLKLVVHIQALHAACFSYELHILVLSIFHTSSITIYFDVSGWHLKESACRIPIRGSSEPKK